MNQERIDKLELMINPTCAQGGNVKFQHVTEEEQEAITEHWKAHGITATQQKYGISNKRIRLILTKQGIADTKKTGRNDNHDQRQQDKLQNALDKLKGMVGKEYLISASLRKVEGYEVRGEFVYVQTRYESGTEKALRIKASELGKELNGFIPYRGLL